MNKKAFNAPRRPDGMRAIIGRAVAVIRNPDHAYGQLHSRTLEDVLADYVKLVMASGLLAGVVSFIWAFGRAAYLQLVRGIVVDYWRLANYQAQVLAGTFFLYLFAGTILFFLASVVVKAARPRAGYTQVVMVLCYALSPVLLFGWVSSRLVPALLVWSVVLLLVGLGYTGVVSRSRRARR